MTKLVWDQVGDRVYQAGLEKGVIYLNNGDAIPWNGLTSVVEHPDKEASPVYFDGMKVQDVVVLGDFSANLKAITYPDEFIELEGLAKVRNGVFLGDQAPQVFDLSYRTLIGNDVDGIDAGYKIHIIYNVTAIPNDKPYSTISQDPSLSLFDWDIYAVPEEISGHRPTAHVILDSRNMDPWLLEDIETKLYGSEFTQPELPSISELISYMAGWYRWKVTDLGDGTYKLESGRGDALIFSGTNLEIFQALGVYVIDHGDGTFTVYDTYDIADVPEIKITDNGDGTWTATTSLDELFGVDPVTGYFNIYNANAVMVSPDEYELSDTTAG